MAYTAPYANSYFWAQQCFTGRKKHPAHRALATALGMDLGHPWLKFPAGTVEQRTCARTVLIRPETGSADVAHRVLTCSPDVASFTNLGGWISKTGVWSVGERQDWFTDDVERALHWIENSHGQHIELAIAETNLVGLVSELGATWSRWGQPLIPIATIHDPLCGPRPRTVVLWHVCRRPVHPHWNTVR